MPYEWVTTPDGVDELHAWPYRSLPRKGFVWFIAASVAIICIPLSALIGTKVLWAVLPFFIAAIWGVWAAIQRSYRDGALLDVLRLAPRRVSLRHHQPGKPDQEWDAAPHWTRLEMHREHRITNYLTLHGGPRDVTLGAFLTPEERKQVYFDVNERLARLTAPDDL